MSTIVLRAPKIDEQTLPADWHPILRQIYAARLQHPDEIERNLSRLLTVDDMPDAMKAAKRIFQAIQTQSTILIYGDYDVDGATSCALLSKALEDLGAKVAVFIPDRKKHGYGLSLAGLADVAATYDLCVTVDNGISAFEAAAHLKAQHIDLIISDHHEMQGDLLPDAYAVVNPKRKDSTFKSKNLAGVGVAFYLLLALRRVYQESGVPFTCALHQYLDLVAVGTVADLVPLDFNNRILVSAGISLIRQGKGNLALTTLCLVAGVEEKRLNSVDIAFALAPRLNAVGRMQHMQESLDFLSIEDRASALEKAVYLDGINRKRKAMESEMFATARLLLDEAQLLLCVYQSNWEEGLLGLVASRLKTLYQKPVLVACDDYHGARIKGSLRSIDGVNMHDLLIQASKHLPEEVLRFGGHAQAGGFSIEKAYYQQWITVLNSELAQKVSGVLPQQVHYVDGSLPQECLSLEWARYLEDLEPWGSGFAPPSFCNDFYVHEVRHLSSEHSRLILIEEKTQKRLLATWFFKCVDFQKGEKIRAVYQLQINRYYGDERLELYIQDAYRL